MLRSFILFLSGFATMLALQGGLTYIDLEPYISINSLIAGVFIGVISFLSFSVAQSIKEDINA